MVTFQLHKWKRPNGQCTFHCGSGTLWIIKIRIMIGPENRGPKTIQDLLGLSNDQIKGWYRIMIVTIWRLISQDIFCFRCADFYSFINRVVEKRPVVGKSLKKWLLEFKWTERYQPTGDAIHREITSNREKSNHRERYFY